MKGAKKLALSGIFSALGFIFLYVGSIFQTLDLTSAALGSIVILIAYIEVGRNRAWCIYAVTSILSLLLLPYKTAAVVFALFSGFYPIIKVNLNKIKPNWLSITARVLCFNLFLTAMYFVTKHLLEIQDEFFAFRAVIFVMANITFLLFDIALERIAIYYSRKIKPKLFGRK